MRKPLTGELEGLRSARRGDYRVIIELHPQDKVVPLMLIGHRSHVYRRG